MHNKHQRWGPPSALSVIPLILDQTYQKQSDTYARPLGMQLCLRPQSELFHSRESLLNDLGRIRRHGGIPTRVPGAPSPLSLINDVDRETLIQEISRPACAAIWLIEPILESRVSSALNRREGYDHVRSLSVPVHERVPMDTFEVASLAITSPRTSGSQTKCQSP